MDSGKEPRDTTPALQGKVSVVSMFSSQWAEQQVATFLSAEKNPDLAKILSNEKNDVQRVHINVEENRMKLWLINMFKRGIRNQLPQEEHSRYFVVHKGFDENLKEAIGMMNRVVGYVYLVDADCRIRWAGSGSAQPEEMEALNSGLQKLIAEQRHSPRP